MASVDVFGQHELVCVFLLRFTGLFGCVRALRAAARVFRIAIDHALEVEPVGALVVCGGFSKRPKRRSSDCDCRFDRLVAQLDLISGEWRPMTELPEARYGATGVACSGKIYIFGGTNSIKVDSILSSVVQCNPVTQVWTVSPPMAQERHGAAAAVLHGDVFVCGGILFDEDEDCVAETDFVERFSPSEVKVAMRPPGSTNRFGRRCVVPVRGKWTSIPPMAVHRDTAVAVALSDKIYVAGGTSDSLGFNPEAASLPGLYFGLDPEAKYPGRALRSVEAFDPITMQWTSVKPMRVSRTEATGAVLRGLLFVCGGRNSTGSCLRSVEAYDPITRCWKVMPPMKVARANAAATVVAGELVVTGGEDNNYESLRSVERYSWDQKKWMFFPPMPWARSQHVAVSLKLSQ
eukprot:TRINITY_DN47146_c0_g1_i1.p1 TRINITY_DN47146_c0_g1~~TRINITY_DN47146_c0_g1_i1.p1  ORF type:complete len:414 (-),score=44.68 TRINITY_DN47146_c0_g1_i1:46-1260(-)